MDSDKKHKCGYQMSENSYQSLLELYAELKLLGSISGVLAWDMNTYMPSQGAEFRSKQFSYIRKKEHALLVSEKFAKLLKEAEKDESLDGHQRRDVELLRRSFDNSTILPKELVASMASQANKTFNLWREAKAKKDFSIVVNDMESLFQLNLQKAEFLAKAKNMNDPFDALISTRDYGFTVEKLTALFDEEKKFLVPFIKKIKNSEVQPDLSFLNRKVARETQVALVNDLAEHLEYEVGLKGRIDEVEHPLTIGCGPKDVRVTVRYKEDQVMKAFFAGSHEVGHALHGLQGNPEWRDQPIYRVASPSFAESQSRILENHISGSKSFWRNYYPKFQKLTGKTFEDISLDDFYFSINSVNPSLARMTADEVTYGLHIIIRFEIERDLFSQKISIKDLPEIWNEKYDQYLGIEVPNDSEGVMQDLHWYSHYWGYFFGYNMGDLIAAQLKTLSLSKAIPDWEDQLEQGSITNIREWLKMKVHYLGGVFDSLDLVKEITGENLNVSYYTSYLKSKYSSLYNI